MGSNCFCSNFHKKWQKSDKKLFRGFFSTNFYWDSVSAEILLCLRRRLRFRFFRFFDRFRFRFRLRNLFSELCWNKIKTMIRNRWLEEGPHNSMDSILALQQLAPGLILGITGDLFSHWTLFSRPCWDLSTAALLSIKWTVHKLDQTHLKLLDSATKKPVAYKAQQFGLHKVKLQL